MAEQSQAKKVTFPAKIVVLDTNIYISAIFWEGPSYHIILKALEKEFLVFISDDIILELRRVLARDFHLQQQEIDDAVEAVVLFTHLVKPKEKVMVVKNDPDDDRILECALACGARTIVTQDNHLLQMKEFQGIQIIHPEKFLIMETGANRYS